MSYFTHPLKAFDYYLWSCMLPTDVAAQALLPTYLTYSFAPMFFSTRLILFWTNWKAPLLKFSYWIQ